MTKVTVILPTYNAEKYLKVLLEALQKQSYKDFELLIVDSSSKDRTVDIARQYTKDIIVIPQQEFDHGGTRAKAAKIASGDILVFLTQDALPYDEYMLENIVSVFSRPDLAAAYGRQISYPDASLFGAHLRLFNYPETSYVRNKEDIDRYGIKTGFLSNSFTAYRKSALESIGWFKSQLILGEDSYAGARFILAGYSLAYVTDSKVFHSHSYTVLEEFRRYFDIGVFHQCEGWLLEAFGTPEGEGFKYLRSEFNYIIQHRAYHLVPEYCVRNFMKYMGYKLGRSYRYIPNRISKYCSMHSGWLVKNISSDRSL